MSATPIDVPRTAIKQESYFKQLDGIRFIAVFLVLYDHLLAGFNTLPIGPIGVTIFFVLSGFLITRILIESKHQYQPRENGLSTYLKKFFIRRTIRIFPIYYLVIFLLVLFNVPPAREKFLWLALYATNIYIAHYETWLGSMDHLWSLAVEEQFYIFFPFLVFFVPTRHLPKILVAFIIGSVSLRLYYFLKGEPWFVSYVLMPTSLDSFGLGGFLAYLYIFQLGHFQRIFRHTALVWLGLIILGGSLYWYHISADPHQSLNSVFERLAGSIFAFFLIGKAILGYDGVMKWVLENPVSIYLGRISYGIYLYHNFVYNHYHTPPTHPVYRLMHRIYREIPALEESYLFNFAAYTLLTILVATLSWYVIEKPINNLKNRFRY
ncbi:acyltransferase family protein [Siphonobacter curvatus]|uniref:Acyltransferase n=1 Tax=Siphonobacter curvatus TaxID=2094562 RepID=A0A2S7ILL3_9BACT|nr:acyltransferase [Siphonobacter curvatus]PQA58518.1 acyltransferase [Siphonobacter curvatus]